MVRRSCFMKKPAFREFGGKCFTRTFACGAFLDVAFRRYHAYGAADRDIMLAPPSRQWWEIVRADAYGGKTWVFSCSDERAVRVALQGEEARGEDTCYENALPEAARNRSEIRSHTHA